MSYSLIVQKLVDKLNSDASFKAAMQASFDESERVGGLDCAYGLRDGKGNDKLLSIWVTSARI